MNTRLAKRALVAGAALVAAGVIAGPGPIVPTLYTHNRYGDRAVWVTIYDLGKTRHLDYGCVSKLSDRSWRSGGYTWGAYYYVRGEVKQNADCSGATLCDTTVQVNPQTNEGWPGAAGPNTSPGARSGTDWAIHPNGTNCYWDQNIM